MPRTVADKLRMLPAKRALVLHAPPGYHEALGVPADAAVAPERGQYDVVQLFVTTAEHLRAGCEAARAALAPGAILWITYPKLTSPLAGELNRDVLYGLMQEMGFQAVAQVAVDDTWSAMRFKPL